MASNDRSVQLSTAHRVVRLLLAFAIGIGISLYVFDRVTDPEPAMQRAREEAAVLAARDILRGYVAEGRELAIVDPVSPDRKAGKVYIYPGNPGWEVSGHYRRDNEGPWHPFLMHLDDDLVLSDLSVRDNSSTVAARAHHDPRFTVRP